MHEFGKVRRKVYVGGGGEREKVMSRRLANLTPEEVERIAERDDTMVMKEEYDHFTPWKEDRVRFAVLKLRSITVNAGSKEEARSQAQKDDELREFSTLYKKMYERLTEPEVARNEAHVKTILRFIELHEMMTAGAMTETQAKSQASDFALASLLSQAGAPPPPESVIEELD